MGARADRGVGMLHGSWGLDETLRRVARLHGDGVLSLDDGSIRRAFAIYARPIAESRFAFSGFRTQPADALRRAVLFPDASTMSSVSFRFEYDAGHGTPASFLSVPTDTQPDCRSVRRLLAPYLRALLKTERSL